ncbi:hypothetical protein M426DRAFT_325677 [Hypoxylon sp. CI-4A]|nr:hypothetical protein M426DRAFT_325677 [Hypoxylon sp. CI-4A]
MRLPYTPNPPQPASQEDRQTIERIQARRAPRPLQPLDLALLHAPAVADGWNGFLGAIRTRTSLPARIRELAICRVGAANGAWYEWGHHAPLLAGEGVGEVGLGIVRRAVLVPEGDKKGGEDGEEEEEEKAKKEALEAGFTEDEWIVLLYADAMTRTVQVDDGLFDRLRARFGEREVVEITATVAAYNCVSRFLVALDVGEKNGTDPDTLTAH